jgi:hypothetical protein
MTNHNVIPAASGPRFQPRFQPVRLTGRRGGIAEFKNSFEFRVKNTDIKMFLVLSLEIGT